MALWYYEQMIATGKWSPRTAPQRPKTKGPEGSARRIRRITEVPDYLQGLDLYQLQATLYPTP